MPSPVFILSTGRTGTQFFEEYFNQTSEAVCRHEPRPSRRFKFLSNLYLNQKIGPQRLGRIYQRSRKKLFGSLKGRPYIESSNFIFGCMDPLQMVFGEVKVIHLVRHPLGYVASHLGKGFWKGHKRFFARYVPYWLETLAVNDRSDPIQLLSARWNYVNQQIGSYATRHPYLRIRFEDLFTDDSHTASETLNRIREFCGLSPLDPRENERWLRRPINASRQTYVLNQAEQKYILATCSALMEEFRYNSEHP